MQRMSESSPLNHPRSKTDLFISFTLLALQGFGGVIAALPGFLVVADALRPGHETAYHPGEANVLLADVLVVNKVDAAPPADVQRVVDALTRLNPTATVLLAQSPATLDAGPSLAGQRVLVIEDGPTITHGGMPFGAGTAAARAGGAAELVDPRPYAVGSLRPELRLRVSEKLLGGAA